MKRVRVGELVYMTGSPIFLHLKMLCIFQRIALKEVLAALLWIVYCDYIGEPMASKLQKISELANQTTQAVTRDANGWMQYLATVSQLYKDVFCKGWM